MMYFIIIKKMVKQVKKRALQKVKKFEKKVEEDTLAEDGSNQGDDDCTICTMISLAELQIQDLTIEEEIGKKIRERLWKPTKAIQKKKVKNPEPTKILPGDLKLVRQWNSA